MNHSETKKLIVTTGVPSPNVYAERVSLVNEAGQPISTKTDAELNSRFAPTRFNVVAYGAVAGTDCSAAFEAAMAALVAAGGGELYVPGATLPYWVDGNLTISDLDFLAIAGDSPDYSVVKLKPSTGAQIVLTSNVVHYVLNNIGFDGNSGLSTASTSQNPLVEHTITAVAGLQDFTVDLADVTFEGSAGGFGHFRAQIAETASASYQKFQRVSASNIRSMYPGNSGASFSVRGPTALVEVDGFYCRNDGQYGIVAKGVPTYSEQYAVALSAEVAYGHRIDLFKCRNLETFRQASATFLQMVTQTDIDGVVTDEDCINPYYDQAATTFTADASTNFLTSTIPSGFGNGSIVKITSTSTPPAPLVAGNLYTVRDVSGSTFKLGLYSGAAAIDITDTGTGTHSVQFMGMTYSTNIKADDCAYTAAQPSRLKFNNVRVTNSSPHSGNRAFSLEESSAGTAGEVEITNSHFVRPVAVNVGHANVCHRIARCTFAEGSATNVQYGTTSSLGVGGARTIVEECRLAPSSVTVGTVKDLTFRNCRFANSLTVSQAASTSGWLRLESNLWNDDDSGTGRLIISPPATGAALRVILRDNRRAYTSAWKIRIPTGGDITTLTIISEGNEIDLDTVTGIANSNAVKWISRNDIGTALAYRGASEYPTTLASSATPSILGGQFFATGGATAITNFTDGIDYQSIKVYIASGHSVTNGANIVTKSGATISGPAVRSFNRLASVWYEV